MTKEPQDSQDGVEFGRYLMEYFERAERVDDAIQPFVRPDVESALGNDDARTPEYPVAAYAHTQLTVATGCIASLKQMLIRQDGNHIELLASPFGPYALIRNALDTSAAALWLLEPQNGTLRVKRRLQLELDEANKAEALLQTMGRPRKSQRRDALDLVATNAQLGEWVLPKKPLPSMTEILRNLQRHHPNGDRFPWLAAWQLASGHAHGKRWAQIASNALEEIPRTRTQTSAQFKMSIRFNVLAGLLLSTIQLLEVASQRYLELFGETI